MKTKQGDAFTILPVLEDNCVDAIITDPPYDLSRQEIDFLSAEFCRVSKGHVLVFCKPENLWPASGYLFWVKPTSTKNFSKSHGRFVEMIAHIQRGNTFNQLFWANMTGVYFDVLEGQRHHPHQKPSALIERLILIHTDVGGIVLDPFVGSGTTEIACRRKRRRFIGFEVQNQWVELVKNRLMAVGK